MNQELFKQIHDTISTKPEQFGMSDWEFTNYANECGTTRCVAGWAIHLTTGQPLYKRNGDKHESFRELADRLGLEPDVETVGATLLELDLEDAQIAFYMGEGRAAKFVKLASEGNETAALNVLDYDDRD